MQAPLSAGILWTDCGSDAALHPQVLPFESPHRWQTLSAVSESLLVLQQIPDIPSPAYPHKAAVFPADIRCAFLPHLAPLKYHVRQSVLLPLWLQDTPS